MNKILIIILLCTNSFCISAQIDCSSKPTTRWLMEVLSKKPIIEVDACWFCLKHNVSDSLKQRMLYLLKSDWTKAEIEQYLERYMESSKSIFLIDSVAKVIAKGDKGLFVRSVDSLNAFYKAKELEALKVNRFYGVNNKLIEAVALLGFKEALPILRRAMVDTEGYYHLPTVQKALARLGDRAMQRKVITDCKPNLALDYDEWQQELANKFMTLYFVGTQECIYATAAFLDTSKLYSYTHNVDGMAAYLVIDFLNDIILNKEFKKIIKGIDLKGISSPSGAFIQQCKNWLIRNKGRYIIKPYCAKIKR
jgi:hypothetical protein